MNLKSIYLCPACGNNLRLETPHVSPDNVILYCGHGPCKVYEMNTGAQASTEPEAYQKLINTLESLQDSGKVESPAKGWPYMLNRQILPSLRPTGIALAPAPLTPNSPNWENSDISKLAEPTADELTGSD